MIKALKIIIEKLTKLHIPYMVIGGIANSIYRNPRQTFDINIKVQVDIETIIATNQHTIKWNYLLENVKMLSAVLDNPDIYHRIKKLQK